MCVHTVSVMCRNHASCELLALFQFSLRSRTLSLSRLDMQLRHQSVSVGVAVMITMIVTEVPKLKFYQISSHLPQPPKKGSEVSPSRCFKFQLPAQLPLALPQNRTLRALSSHLSNGNNITCLASFTYQMRKQELTCSYFLQTLH